MIQVLAADTPQRSFGVFFDPDTGIRLPGENQRASVSYAPISFITEVFAHLKPMYVVCFDQNHHRVRDFSKSDQRRRKLDALQEDGIVAFYYVSHALFLFGARGATDLEKVRTHLVKSGIPEWRFEDSVG